jgi:hypothetical protein
MLKGEVLFVSGSLRRESYNTARVREVQLPTFCCSRTRS